MTRGGARKGAGRPPAAPDSKKIAVTKRLARDVVAYLKSCDNATDAIETAIRQSAKYQAWKGRK